MPISRRIGLVLLVVTAVVWAGWKLWANTRTWCPVDVPLSLTEGSRTVTSEFTVNLSGPYDIEVEATGNHQVPLSEVVCSLGLGPLWPEKQCSTKSVLRASWVLTSHERQVAEGLSDSETGGATAEGWSSATRTIGRFNARRGQTFRLRVETLADASSLSATNPRLRVSMNGTRYESVLVFDGLFKVACVATAILAVLLLLVSLSAPPRIGPPALQ